MRRRVLRVQLEHRPLEVLHGIGLAVYLGALLHLPGDGIALPGEAAVGLPVLEKPSPDRVSGFGEVTLTR